MSKSAFHFEKNSVHLGSKVGKWKVKCYSLRSTKIPVRKINLQKGKPCLLGLSVSNRNSCLNLLQTFYVSSRMAGFMKNVENENKYSGTSI